MSRKFGVFNPFKKWKKGDLPYDPTVTIALSQWGTSDGVVTISESLASDTEIDFAIDQLKLDLESVRKEAKQVLQSQRAIICSSIG